MVDKKVENFAKRREIIEKDEEKKNGYRNIVYRELERKKQHEVQKEQKVSNSHIRRAEFCKKLRQVQENMIKDENLKLKIPPHKKRIKQEELEK